MKLTAQTIKGILADKCAVLSTDNLIVAVSGGADSMALLHLLSKLDYQLLAAHCNFGLRGEQSDADECLVADYCKGSGIALKTIKFDTDNYAKENGISIEMAARDLRYNWFDKLTVEHGFNVVITGHHGNDSIETFFLNLVRGTGLRGLSGMHYRNKKVVRPLLDFPREAVEKYCQEESIVYRHDESNDDTKFIRNKIRHEIIPVLESINPSFYKTMQANIEHLKDAELGLDSEIMRFKKCDMVNEDNKVIIPISKLDNYPLYKSILFEVLKDFGFNASIVSDVIKHLNNSSGKQFFSETHRLIKDRYNLLVLPIDEADVGHFWVEEGQNKDILNVDVRVFSKPKDFTFSRESSLIHLDADLIDLPLMVRKWEKGDSFVPLGMKGFKKVSDFFIDEKYSLLDKEAAWLMLSGEDVIWIVGKRVDDRYKVTNRTKNIMEIKLMTE